MKREEKNSIVTDLAEKLSNYKFVYLTDTADLTAVKTNGLRRELNKRGITMQVAKNTLIRKAMEQSGQSYGELISVLKGTSALMFSNDAKSPAQVIQDFRKTSNKPLLKGAYIDSDIFMGDDQIDVLLKLKSIINNCFFKTHSQKKLTIFKNYKNFIFFLLTKIAIVVIDCFTFAGHCPVNIIPR